MCRTIVRAHVYSAGGGLYYSYRDNRKANLDPSHAKGWTSFPFICMHACGHPHASAPLARMCIRMRNRNRIRIRICIRIGIRICLRMRIRTCVRIRFRLRHCIRIHTCIHICIRIRNRTSNRIRMSARAHMHDTYV